MTVYPCVSNGVLVYSVKNEKRIIRVESEDWWNWLSDCNVKMFRYESRWGSFTAQREQKNGRWYALFLQRGSTYKQYLGEFTELTARHLLRCAYLLKKHCLPSSSSLGAPDQKVGLSVSGASDLRLYDILSVTKLKPPSLRSSLVSRPHLIEKLREGVRRKLTLLSAPAGSGKTTSVSALYTLFTQEKRPIAWLTLDEGDNDLVRFLAYTIAALDTIYPTMQETLQPLLYTPSPFIPCFLAALINTIDALPRDFVFVLDSYQVITSPEIHEAVTFLLDHAPEHMHLLLSTRTIAPFPLARLRAAGQVTELYKNDLCFTLDETATFFQQTLRTHISKEITAAFHDYAEGWITGIQLTSLSLAEDRRYDRGQIMPLIGDWQHLIEYFHEEVLSKHPPYIQNFLLSTSLVERFNCSLCNALTEQSESQAILKILEQTNSFIIRVEGELFCYRYHPMFRHFLRSVLYHTYPEHVVLLKQRASLWYKQHNMVLENSLEDLRMSDEDALHAIKQSKDVEVAPDNTSTLLADATPYEGVYRPRAALSRREVEIVQCVTIGLSNQAAARRMCIAESTVRWYIKNIYLKLDVHNRVQLVIRAKELGITKEETIV